jgi:hypothetical protein
MCGGGSAPSEGRRRAERQWKFPELPRLIECRRAKLTQAKRYIEYRMIIKKTAANVLNDQVSYGQFSDPGPSIDIDDHLSPTMRQWARMKPL